MPPGLRDRKKQQAREAIVDAALELFAHDGYDDTTVQAVADRAGVSAATVARYFPTKDSLLFAERDTRIAALRAAVLGRPARESPLRAVIASLADQAPFTDTTRIRLLRSRQAIARSTVLRGRSVHLLDEWRDGIADALDERGVDPFDARVLATAVIAVLDDAATRWADDGGHRDLRDDIQRALRVLETRRKP